MIEKNIKIILIIILTILDSCNDNSITSTESKQLVTDSTIYEVINEIIHPENFKGDFTLCHFVAEKDLMHMEFLSEDSILLTKIDSLFSKEDLTFINEQLKLSKDFKIQKEFVPWMTIIPEDTLIKFRSNGNQKGVGIFWENYYNKYGKTGFCSIRRPLFSKNNLIVILNMSYYCGGRCGYGSTLIYKNLDGTWTLIKKLDNWES